MPFVIGKWNGEWHDLPPKEYRGDYDIEIAYSYYGFTWELYQHNRLVATGTTETKLGAYWQAFKVWRKDKKQYG